MKDQSPRTEFGVQRSTCDCADCIDNCLHMPGMLLPSDIPRIIGFLGATEMERPQWAERHLLASPGAIVANAATGQRSRIPTLVPAVKSDGSCIFLTDDRRCSIHAASPFGCAFFSCKSEPDGLMKRGLLVVQSEHAPGWLYGVIWRHLHRLGLRQHGPEVLRERMAKGRP